MERLDIHVALEVCEIVIESATLGSGCYSITSLRKSQSLSRQIDSSVAHALALSGLPVYVASSPLGSIHSVCVPSFL
jgi:hypothetical protein